MKSKSGKKWKMMYYLVVHFFYKEQKEKTTTAIAQKIQLALQEEFSRPTDTRNHTLQQSIQGIKGEKVHSPLMVSQVFPMES